MQLHLARSLPMLAATSRRAPVLYRVQAARISSLLHASSSHITKPAHQHLRPVSTTTAKQLTYHGRGSDNNNNNNNNNNSGDNSFISGNIMFPVGIVGGVALFLYTKRNNGPVYSEVLFDIGRNEASMRLKILHEQSAKVSKQMTNKTETPEQQQMDEAQQQTKKSRLSLITHMVRLLAPECWLFLGVALTAVGAAVVNLWTPVVTGDLINVIARSIKTISDMDSSLIMDALGSPARKLLVLFVANGLLTFAHTTLVTILGERIGMRLHTQAMHTLLGHDLAFFDASQSGELVSRITTDIAEFQSTFKKLVTQGLKSATLTVGVAFQLIRLSPTLSLSLISTMPIVYAGLALYGRLLRSLRRDAREWEAISSGIAGEAIGNIRTVRSLSAEMAELQLYREARAEASACNNRFGLHMGAFSGLTNTAIGTMILTVLHTGGRLVARGDMTPGDLMAFMIATQSAQRALGSLGVLMGQTVKAKGAVTRVFEIINLTPTIPRNGGVCMPNVQGHVRFMDVDFAYPSRRDVAVLKHFNLDIPAGQVVALCGLSGSGKSTVAALLERFYDPVSGEIWLDACPLKKLDPSWHRSQIGFIPQEPALFSTSIKENLRLANPLASDDQIEEACKQANAHDFILKFPGGYDTVVGERGTLLSGGQKQRLSIARAILRDPKILILDEATSSLDAESERLVQSALDRLMVGRTVLVIAHRLTTIRNADRIVVMGNVPGHIVEQGTHDELLAKRGAYFKLYTDIKPDQ